MPKKLLEMKDITKRFSGIPVLKKVCFEAEEGEIIAIVGENGAGKSTLMKILSGFYPCDTYEGNIMINGEKMSFYSLKQVEEAGIAMIYQETNMNLDLSIAENLFIGHWPQKNGMIDWKEINLKAKELMELIGININPNIILRNLSASEQQLVAIIKALRKQPKILVLDEPTSALTQSETKKLFDILRKLKEKNVTSILISHKLDEVFEISDRITVLRDGQNIATHKKDDVSPEEVVNGMVGRSISSFYPKEEVNIGEVVFRIESFTVYHPYTRNKFVVEDVSFDLRKGEVLGIAGLVGSGRSELVNAVFGYIRKKEGRIFLNGSEIIINNPIDAIRHRIALVTEDRKANGFVGLLSIKENATLASINHISKLSLINKKKEKSEAQKYYEMLNIKAGKGPNTLMQTLSGGNQQKVVLSKWLMIKPQILIFDEPTRGIDVGAKYEIYKIMMGLVKKGTSIILISSEWPELLSMSDRIIVLTNGKIRSEFNAKECSQDKIISAATRASDVTTKSSFENNAF